MMRKCKICEIIYHAAPEQLCSLCALCVTVTDLIKKTDAYKNFQELLEKESTPEKESADREVGK